MRDDGEKDDLDLESLADKVAIAEYRPLSPDEVLEQERVGQRSASSGDVFSRFVGCGDGGGGCAQQSGRDYF